MKTNKTEEKKCEQVCHGIHINHGEHCQKEQPECPCFTNESQNGLPCPHDHRPMNNENAFKHCPDCQKEQPEQDLFLCAKCLNYFVSKESTPPQELRQEEWEKEYFDKFCITRGGGRDGLSDPEPLYDVLYEQDPENLKEFIKSLLKNIEQKAREEAFKAVKALVPIESYSYYDYGWKRVYDINDVPENYPKEHIRKHYPDEWHEFYESLLKLQKS